MANRFAPDQADPSSIWFIGDIAACWAFVANARSTSAATFDRSRMTAVDRTAVSTRWCVRTTRSTTSLRYRTSVSILAAAVRCRANVTGVERTVLAI
ncbi:MAG: hypothetical protein M3354_02090, partial [Chloroflexota bacterium]|nr:hypothetical protein [Chloroflexota bacterium]